MICFNEKVIGENVDELWKSWFMQYLISSENDIQSSRDGDVIGEVINATSVLLDPTKNIMKNKDRNLSMRYAIGEMLWYMSGNNSLKEIQKYTSGWDRMSDDGKVVNSNYGYCIKKKFGFDQWEYTRELLDRYPDTRQAVIHIKEPSNKISNDVNCTVCLQFFIRNGKLYMTTYMRSNDIWMGFPYDVFQFTNMQILMSMELGCDIGTYTHITGSLHLYKRDYDNWKNRMLKEKKR